MTIEAAIKNIAEGASRLASMDPQDEAVKRTIEGLQENAAMIGEEKKDKPSSSWGDHSLDQDAAFIAEQIKCLKAAALQPARNYTRIISIVEGLERAIVACQRPENAPLLPRIAAATRQVAGVFKKVDTVDDLEKPLEAIEKAVHALYGPDQSRNDAYFFDRKGKGHHGEKE